MQKYNFATVGAVGAWIAAQFGGWDYALQTLIGFMAVDYITGMIVAGVFHKSPKTQGGALSSIAGWRGLFKKGGELAVVYVACRVDMLIGSDYLRDGVVIAYIVNEGVSITENLGLMGVPMPEMLKKAIDALKNKKEAN